MAVVVLLGPKGSGKSHIGRLIEQRYNSATFLEIEKLAIEFLNKHGGSVTIWDDASHRRLFYDEIHSRVKEMVANSNKKMNQNIIIFETTGAAPETKTFLQELKDDKNVGLVYLIRVHSSATTCLERIQSRDTSQHVNVPLEMIQRLHAATDALDLTWDMQLNNEGLLSKEDILESMDELLLCREG